MCLSVYIGVIGGVSFVVCCVLFDAWCRCLLVVVCSVCVFV